MVIPYAKTKQIFGSKIQSSRQKWMTTLNSHFLRKKMIFFLTLLSRIVGLALKSLTGSRRIVELLNRMGHCVNYHAVVELETEMTFEARNRSMYTPYGMDLLSSVGTGLAWDNFDRFVETNSGKDTLHDTVGIAYQIAQSDVFHDFTIGETNTEVDGSSEECNEANTISSVPKKRRRRIFESSGLNIQPYRKKPKMTNALLLGKEDERKIQSPTVTEKLDNALLEDMMWMIDVYTNEEKTTPMWVGWNSLRDKQPPLHQKIWYLPQINESPTSNSVVIETMRRSLEIAKECKRESIAVTYDLAIAKIALQIQFEERPTFDNLFIHLGSFHIEMALLKAFGKVIAESGGPHILNECEVLAKGSISSVCQGKNYKRSKKMHELLSLTMQTLHFEQYIRTHENGKDMLDILIKQRRSLRHSEESVPSKEATEVFVEYKKFTCDTKNGKYGKTAQFWLNYIDMVHELPYLYKKYSFRRPADVYSNAT